MHWKTQYPVPRKAVLFLTPSVLVIQLKSTIKDKSDLRYFILKTPGFYTLVKGFVLEIAHLPAHWLLLVLLSLQKPPFGPHHTVTEHFLVTLKYLRSISESVSSSCKDLFLALYRNKVVLISKVSFLSMTDCLRQQDIAQCSSFHAFETAFGSLFKI